MSTERLNAHAQERVNDYKNLQIHGKTVSTPYFINKVESYFVDMMKKAGIPEAQISSVREQFRNREALWGWGRGKGTPEEIQRDTLTLSDLVGLPLQGATKDGVIEFMKLYGIGIDCSGLVYNVFSYAFDKSGNFESYDKSLAWINPNERRAVSAGAFVFAGKASDQIPSDEVGPLDLILIKGRGNRYVHVAMLLMDSEGLKVTQSTIACMPTGINESRFVVNAGQPQFEYVPTIGERWEELHANGSLEFRRLKVLQNEG